LRNRTMKGDERPIGKMKDGLRMPRVTLLEVVRPRNWYSPLAKEATLSSALFPRGEKERKAMGRGEIYYSYPLFRRKEETLDEFIGGEEKKIS